MRMRRVGWALLVAAMVACGTTVRSGDVIWYDRTVTDAEPRVWQRFGVELPANPSTGYRWRLARALDESVVILIDREFVDGAGPGGWEGAESWVFRAEGLGTETIRLEYVPVGAADPVPADTWRLTVRVRHGGFTCSSSSG